MQQLTQFEKKLQNLKEILSGYDKLAVAFSGGVDSTFLLKIASDVLGENVTAITVNSSSISKREFGEALEFTASIGVRHIIHEINEFEIEGFSSNPPERCYICKKSIFEGIKAIASKDGIYTIADGSNADDLNDYRPGMKALAEMLVVSPLLEAGLTKSEIRELSKQAGLASWDKPALACLATRIPFGHQITKEKLRMIEEAEEYLMGLGFRQVRVRHHGEIARIEVAAGERERFWTGGMNAETKLAIMEDVSRKLKEIGFRYVTLDLEGYRTGSMNEGLISTEGVIDSGGVLGYEGVISTVDNG